MKLIPDCPENVGVNENGLDVMSVCGRPTFSQSPIFTLCHVTVARIASGG